MAITLLNQFLKDLITHLSGNTGVTDLVSSRIWNTFAKQGETLPYVVFTVTSSDELQDHGGDTGMSTFRVQFDIISDAAGDTSQIRDALRNALSGISKSTAFGGGTTKVGHSKIETENDFWDEVPEYYRKVVDISFTINALA